MLLGLFGPPGLGVLGDVGDGAIAGQRVGQPLQRAASSLRVAGPVAGPVAGHVAGALVALVAGHVAGPLAARVAGLVAGPVVAAGASSNPLASSSIMADAPAASAARQRRMST